KIIALSYGLKIKAYNGHTSGIDYDHVQYQLVREPKFAIRPDKSKILPNDKRNLTSLNDDILIVGQEPYAANFGKKVYKDKLLKLVDCIKSDINFNTEKTVYYKSHRHGPRIEIEFFNRMFIANTLVYLEDDLSMEDLY